MRSKDAFVGVVPGAVTDALKYRDLDSNVSVLPMHENIDGGVGACGHLVSEPVATSAIRSSWIAQATDVRTYVDVLRALFVRRL